MKVYVKPGGGQLKIMTVGTSIECRGRSCWMEFMWAQILQGRGVTPSSGDRIGSDGYDDFIENKFDIISIIGQKY